MHKLFNILILCSEIIITFLLCKYTINTGLVGSIIGALIGSSIGYFSQRHFRKSDSENKEKHYSLMLYYDLLSIEDYIDNEKSSVDIRYSQDWQHIVANCVSLEPEYIQVIYKLYDLIYNFDSHFKECKKIQQNTCKKEDIEELM